MDVSYATLQKALADAGGKGGIYEGAMEAQSKTKAGRWATVQDNFGNVASDIGDAFSPVLDKLLNVAVQFAEWIPKGLEMAKPYIDMISNGVGQVVDYVMNIVNGTSDWSGWIEIIQDHFSGIWEIVSGIGMKLIGFVASIIDFIKKSEIIKDIFRFVGWVMEKAWGVIGSMIDAVVWLWENILKPILEALDTAYKWIKGVDDVNIKTTKTLVAPKKADEKTNPFTENKKMVDSNAASSKEVGASVVGGGPKTININVGKFFDNIQFTTLNGGESAQELENIVMECLGRVLYQGSKVI